MTTILTKRSNTPGAVPVTANLTNAAGGAELAVNTADKRLFTLNSANNVVEVGTNPSSLTCADVSATVLRAGSATITNLIATSASITTLTNNPTLSGGTANGVLYLNGSKVATSGSTLTFDGTNLTLGGSGSGSRLVVRGTGTTSATFSIEAATSGGATRFLVADDGLCRWYGTSNAETMRLDNAGNLGIGTASPAFRLEVAGNARILNSGADSQFIITAPTDAYAPYVRWGVSGIRDSGILGFPVGDDALVYRSQANSFSTGTERFRITVAGNVGIGTSSPGYKLDVNATGGSAATARLNGNDQANVRLRLENGGSGGRTWELVGGLPGANNSNFSLYDVTGTATRLTVDSSGNLGIGTASPEAILHVAKSTSGGLGAQLVLDNNASTALNNATEISFLNENGASGSGTRNARIRSIITNAGDAASALQFYTWSGSTDAERARITAGGNLLVGTLTDLGYAARLDVDSAGGETAAFKSSGGTLSYVQRVWNSATSGDNLFVWFGTEAGGTTRGSITYNRGAGQVAYNVTSDARLKENIADAEEAGDKIDAMQVRQFDWKETGNHLDYGFVAQELHAVAPHAVSKPEDEEAMWSVDYSKLVPMLVKEIQSLRSRVSALEAQ